MKLKSDLFDILKNRKDKQDKQHKLNQEYNERLAQKMILSVGGTAIFGMFVLIGLGEPKEFDTAVKNIETCQVWKIMTVKNICPHIRSLIPFIAQTRKKMLLSHSI